MNFEASTMNDKQNNSQENETFKNSFEVLFFDGVKVKINGISDILPPNNRKQNGGIIKINFDTLEKAKCSNYQIKKKVHKFIKTSLCLSIDYGNVEAQKRWLERNVSVIS